MNLSITSIIRNHCQLMAPPTAYSIGMGSTKFIITINADNQTMKINDKNPLVILHSELSPIIMMYNNNEKRIPILFDAYYHTNFSETIFFRGNAACVSMFYSHNIWEDTQYVRNAESLMICDMTKFVSFQLNVKDLSLSKGLEMIRHGQWGVSQNPPVIEKISKPPPSPREARRQNFRVF